MIDNDNLFLGKNYLSDHLEYNYYYENQYGNSMS